MANPEDVAKEFLRGLKTRKRQPWDEVTSEPPATPAPKAPPKPAASYADEPMSQAERIAERNRKFADRTRFLRKD